MQRYLVPYSLWLRRLTDDHLTPSSSICVACRQEMVTLHIHHSNIVWTQWDIRGSGSEQWDGHPHMLWLPSFPRNSRGPSSFPGKLLATTMSRKLLGFPHEH